MLLLKKGVVSQVFQRSGKEKGESPLHISPVHFGIRVQSDEPGSMSDTPGPSWDACPRKVRRMSLAPCPPGEG